MTYHLTEGPDTGGAWHGFYVWEDGVLYQTDTQWNVIRRINMAWPLPTLLKDIERGYFAVVHTPHPALMVEEGL